jgi:hypothetical protein
MRPTDGDRRETAVLFNIGAAGPQYHWATGGTVSIRLIMPVVAIVALIAPGNS